MTDRTAAGLSGGSLRTHAARGTIITSAFTVALGSLQLVRGLLLAALLTPEDYGVWGILLISLGTLTWLKQIGVGQRFVQQDEEDQELEFQRAFTLEAILNAGLGVLVVLAVPVMALAYGEDRIVLPGLALVLLLPAMTLQASLWVLYRRMQYAKQRAITAIDPVLGLVVAIVAASLGAGYWSFLLAAMAGTWATALVAVVVCPYKLRLTFDRVRARDYVQFSAPLLVSSVGGIVVAQGSILAGQATGGLVAAGAITLASQITMFTNKVDQVLSDTLYPAICAVSDKTDLLFETFVKSNRLALMWALPFGFGLALFAPDLIDLGFLDEDWEPAIVVLQAFGAAAAIGHLGFNWTSYFMARADTRPIAVSSVLSAVAFLAVELPLIIAFGLDGVAAGTLVLVAVLLAVRWFYLRRLFVGLRLLPHALRALTPAVPPVVVVLLLRSTVETGPRSTTQIALEVATYGVITLVGTVFAERALLGEALGYVRGRRAAAAPTAPAA